MAKATIAGGIQGPVGPKGDKGDSGDMGNFTGVANFTDANGFTGNVTNNNLSLTLQYANSTQDGQVTSTNFNDWQSKGTSNLTIGVTNITAFAGDVGAGAVSNITGLQNLTTNLSTTSNTTTSILNGAVSNITTLQNLTTNLTESKLNITDALQLGSTNITAYRGDLGVANSENITTLQGDLANHTGNFTNPHNVTKAQVGLSNVTDVTPLELPVSNATQTALNGKQDTLVSGTNIKTINGDSLLGSGDLIVTGGNFTGIESFTDSGGFTGTVTNNSLSLVLQHANATQDGQISSTNYNDWQGKGTSNLTVGNTTTTAFQGDLGQVAYNHTSLTNNPHNVTKSQVGLSNVSDVTSLELPVSNATQTALDLKVDKTTTINGQNLSSNITLNVSLFGDITGSGSTNITTTLATVNSNTGIFGNATVVPSITVNEKGLITAASNNTIPTANTTTTGLVTSTKYNDWEAKGTSNLSYVQGNGTVNGLTLTGNITTSGNLTLGGVLAVAASDFSSQTANTFLAAPNGSNGTPTFRAIVAADIPVLNQNTTGNAATVTTNANLTGEVTSNGNSASLGSFDSSRLATALTDETGTGNAVFSNNCTLNTPNLTTPSYINATNAIGVAPSLTSGNVTNIPNLTGVITGNSTGVTSLTSNGVNSSQVASWVSDETGTGSLVFATNATFVTPTLGTPASGNLANAVGLPLTTGITGTLNISNGGTNATTAEQALTNLNAVSKADFSQSFLLMGA